jgi:hypothetical protein
VATQDVDETSRQIGTVRQLRAELHYDWVDEHALLQKSQVAFSRIYFFFFLVSRGALSPFGTSATVWPKYQPRMIDDNERGTFGGMRIGRGNRSTRGKPAQCHFVHHKSHVT